MIIDKSKVAVFYNTDDPTGDSLTVANYYQQARGLDPAKVVGFPFGLLSNIQYAASAAYRAGVLTDVKTYIDSIGDLEGIILSINAPRYVRLTNTGDYLSTNSFCKILGSIDAAMPIDSNCINSIERTYRFVDNINGENSGLYEPWNHYHGPAKDGVVLYSDGVPVSDYRNAGQLFSYKTIPCGRLGYQNAFNDDAALAMRCVDDAIWYEQNGNPADSPMRISLSTRATLVLTWANQYEAYLALNGRIKTIYTSDGDSFDSAGSKYAADSWSFAKPPITIADQKTWFRGGGPVLDIWGWVGCGLHNVSPINAYLPSVNFLRGAWMFESTSTNVSGQSLAAGACACISPVDEPTTGGLPVVDTLVRLLMEGYSMMEAELCATPPDLGAGFYSRLSEAWGDPMYSPLASLGRNKAHSLSADIADQE